MLYELSLRIFYPTIWNKIQKIKNSIYHTLQYIDINTIYYNSMILEKKDDKSIICTYKTTKVVIHNYKKLSFGKAIEYLINADTKNE